MTLYPVRRAKLAPVLLFLGPEEFLYRKTATRLKHQQRSADPNTTVHSLDAAAYTPGELLASTEPSLFSGANFVTVDHLATMSDEFAADLERFLAEPSADSVVVFHYSGGNRGKKLVDRLKQTAAQYDCSTPKKEAEKIAYAKAEFAAGDVSVTPDALAALVAVVGQSLAELDAACAQLMADVPAEVTRATIEEYYGVQAEVTAFKVADAALAGSTALALGEARTAVESGTDPIALIAAFAMKVRSMARVAGRTEAQAVLAKEFGMAPWQVKNAQSEARRYSAEAMAQAVTAVAEADYLAKGGSRSPEFVVERLIIQLGRLVEGSRRR